MFTPIPRRKFTIEEYHRLAEIGMLSEHERIELIAGEIITVPPLGSHHESCIARLKQVFSTVFSENAIVWVRNPIRLGGYSEPEPDIALLKPRADLYTEYRPHTKDILLLVECLHQVLAYERELKLPVYAEAGIQEVWIVDLDQRAVEIYTQPFKQEYSVFRKLQKGNRICSDTFPELNITVDDILA